MIAQADARSVRHAEPGRAYSRQAGNGAVELRHVAGRTAVVRAESSSPLKLLHARLRGPCAWLFTSTYGGGLVDGDSIDLDLTIGAGTRCLLSTQASTKVYRSPTFGCRQTTNAWIGEGAMLFVAPDPIVCFKDARFIQRQRFSLSAGAGLVAVDWLSSGRWACGERWAFAKYESQTEVDVDGRPVHRDVLALDPIDGPIDAPMRMGRFECFATVLALGDALSLAAGKLLNFLAEQTAPRAGDELIFAASPAAGGVVVRVAGPSCEVVSRWIREQLDFVPGLVGEDPWERKW